MVFYNREIMHVSPVLDNNVGLGVACRLLVAGLVDGRLAGSGQEEGDILALHPEHLKVGIPLLLSFQ
jgi:hypothetical protein